MLFDRGVRALEIGLSPHDVEIDVPLQAPRHNKARVCVRMKDRNCPRTKYVFLVAADHLLELKFPQDFVLIPRIL